jgi:5-methylcytosine-specific restriction endonuclease McrA
MRKTISAEMRRHIAERANYCCEYCHAPSFLALAVVTSFEIEHIIPKSKGGTYEENNLAYSCPRCNRLKSDRTEAIDPETKLIVSWFNPRQQHWSEHFAYSEDGA